MKFNRAAVPVIEATPAVSILMAAYNAEKYVAAAVESLQNQTYEDFELIIVDDASSDSTSVILAELASRDRRICLLQNEVNRGLVHSLNRGLARCRAPLVARADNDDVYHPERIARQIAYLNTHPNVGVLGSAVEFIDENGLPVTRTLHDFPLSSDEVRLSSMFGCCLWHTTVVFRKALVEGVGGYSSSFNRGPEDFDLWARLLDTTEMANLDEPLAKQRLHSKSMTAMWTIGNDLYCTIAQRLMSRYLQRDVDFAEAKAVVSVCSWGQYIDDAFCQRGVSLLRQLVVACKERELPSVASWFCRKYGLSLIRYAGTIVYRQRVTAFYLLRTACSLSPGLSLSPKLLKIFLRLIVPARVRDFFKATRGRRNVPTK